MYFVFDLPTPGADTIPTAHTVAFWLHREFDEWSMKYHIPYRTKFHKNRLRFILGNDTEYHFFLLSWNPNLIIGTYTMEPEWIRPHVIETPKR